MKPTKVYILPTQYDLQYDNGGEAYVRLADILNWARDSMKLYIDEYARYGDSITFGKYDAFKRMVDKLTYL